MDSQQAKPYSRKDLKATSLISCFCSILQSNLSAMAIDFVGLFFFFFHLTSPVVMYVCVMMF